MKLKHYGLIIIPVIIISQIMIVPERTKSEYIPQAISKNEIAYYWAPVWDQDTYSSDFEADYITKFDYDGNWIGNDNWNNFGSYPLNATIYYSILETETHWFIGYYDYHPRDWSETGLFQHENDMEGVLIVVKKDGTDWGQFYCMITEAHTNFYQYIDYETPASANLTDNYDDIDGDVEFETVNNYYLNFNFSSHAHPIAYVDAKGHGVYGDKRWEDSDFPDNDGVIYKPMGKSEEPLSGNDRNVSYALTSIEVLWERRYGPYGSGQTFGSFSAFDGDDYGEDKANPPWSWDDSDDGPTYSGEIFYNPADVIATHFGNLGSFNHTYLSNPYAFQLRIDRFRVNWDLDDEGDYSDGYFNLYMFHSDGKPTQLDGVLDGDDGSQYTWIGENMITGEWLEMHDEIPRPLYGIHYPDRPYFGINCKEWDEFTPDPWLMDKTRTHWYGPTGTSRYEGKKVIVIDVGQSLLDWEGAEVYLTINVILGNFTSVEVSLPKVVYFLPIVTLVNLAILIIRKKKIAK